MSNTFVLTFRNDLSQRPSPEQEQAWTAWFGQIGAHITDLGNRVGRAVMLGQSAEHDQLSGYIVLAADNLDAAVEIASTAPAWPTAAASRSAKSSPRPDKNTTGTGGTPRSGLPGRS